MKTLSQIANFYLGIVSAFYIALGLGGLGLSSGLYLLTMLLASTGSFIGAIPGRAITLLLDKFPYGHSRFDWIVPVLSVAAIILGIIAITALLRMKKNHKWVFVWYFLLVLSVLIAIDNTILLLSHKPNIIFISQFLHPLLMYLSVRTLDGKTSQEKKETV